MARFPRFFSDFFGQRAADEPSATNVRVNVDPATLMKLKSLELRARAVVEGFMAGLHRSPWHGFSVEFSDYRPYSPGDDVRYLDWRLFARQDRYYVKRFEDETNLRCYLVLDLSRSMEFSTLSWTKADYARTLLATFAFFLGMQHDACGLITFDERVGDYIPPRYRPGHLRRILCGLEKATAGTETTLGPTLEQVARLTRGRGMVALVSDMLAPLGDLERRLGYLRSQGHEVILLRVLDPRELDLDFPEARIFEDLESGRELFVDSAAIARSYRERFAAHAGELEKICRSAGIQLVTLTTDQPLAVGLADFIQQRKRFSIHRTARMPASTSAGMEGNR